MDIAIFAGATLISIGVAVYMYALSNIKKIKANWPEHRCNPIYMPMAGLVGQDVFTNFTGCVMKNFQDYAGFMMDPIMSLFSDLTSGVSEISDAMDDMRGMMSDVRGGFLGIVGTVFGKIENLMSQFQYIIIRMRTLLARVVGIMMSFMYIFYGGMQTGESVGAGPIGQTVSFLCFDPRTPIETFYGEKLMISDAALGLKLKGGGTVISAYIVSGKGVEMYTLDGVNVSGNHKVIFNGTPTAVKFHPDAKRSANLPFLYCIDTSNNRIFIGNTEFLDFSEDTSFSKCAKARIDTEMFYNHHVSPKNAVNVLGYQHIQGVSPHTTVVMNNGTLKLAKEVEIEDVLEGGAVVKTVVYHSSNSTQFCELAPDIFAHPRTWILDKDNICSALSLSTVNLEKKPSVVFHFITSSSNYTVANKAGDRFTLLDQLSQV
jgi:hypothetical protein